MTSPQPSFPAFTRSPGIMTSIGAVAGLVIAYLFTDTGICSSTIDVGAVLSRGGSLGGINALCAGAARAVFNHSVGGLLAGAVAGYFGGQLLGSRGVTVASDHTPSQAFRLPKSVRNAALVIVAILALTFILNLLFGLFGGIWGRG